MTSPAAGLRGSKRHAPLVFVSTNTAVLSEASKTAARSHAASWSRRRLREAKAKPNADRDREHAADEATNSDDAAIVWSCESEPCQTLQHYSGKTKTKATQLSRQLEEKLDLSLQSRRSHAKQRSRRHDDGHHEREDPSDFSVVVCGMNGAVDPFDSLAVKVDSHAHNLLQFYRSSPWAWDSQPYALGHSNLNSDSGDILSGCMSSRLHYYTFLSLSAAVMEVLGIKDINFPRATLYAHQAVTEMQIQLRHEDVDEQDLLHGVSTLSIAAALQRDVVAARAHLQAAKYLVERLGGFGGLRRSIVQHISYGDFHLSLETLSPTVFELAFEPAGFPELEHSPDPLLEQTGQIALRLSQMCLSPSLLQGLERTIQCAEVVDRIWGQARSPSMQNFEWLASKIGATINKLLSTTSEITIHSHARKAQEATKVILVLWNLITLMFAKCVIDPDVSVRSSMPIFRRSTLEAMREHWPPWIYLGLMSWNEMVRSPSSEAESRANLCSLINVVRSMETEALVHLADFMDRLYQLEDIYRMKNDCSKPSNSSYREKVLHSHDLT